MTKQTGSWLQRYVERVRRERQAAAQRAKDKASQPAVEEVDAFSSFDREKK